MTAAVVTFIILAIAGVVIGAQLQDRPERHWFWKPMIRGPLIAAAWASVALLVIAAITVLIYLLHIIDTTPH